MQKPKQGFDSTREIKAGKRSKFKTHPVVAIRRVLAAKTGMVFFVTMTSQPSLYVLGNHLIRRERWQNSKKNVWWIGLWMIVCRGRRDRGRRVWCGDGCASHLHRPTTCAVFASYVCGRFLLFLACHTRRPRNSQATHAHTHIIKHKTHALFVCFSISRVVIFSPQFSSVVLELSSPPWQTTSPRPLRDVRHARQLFGPTNVLINRRKKPPFPASHRPFVRLPKL